MRLPIAVVSPLLAGLFLAVPAKASLTAAGEFVQVFFNGPGIDVGEPELSPAPTISLNSAAPTSLGCDTSTPPCVGYNTPAAGNVTIEPGAEDDSKIVFTANTISIINEDNAAFCSSGSLPCTSQATSWWFQFDFTGLTIGQVSVDSSSGFLPTGGNSGLVLLSPTEIRVYVGNQSPAIGAALILDVGTIPEPATVWLLGGGLALLAIAGQRRRLLSVLS